jgi:penicillin-binding protein 1A
MATTGTPKRTPSRGPNTPTRPPGNGGGGNGKGRPAPRRRRNPVWGRIKAFFQIITIFVVVAVLTLMAWVFWRLHSAPPGIDLPTASRGITYVYSSDGTPLAEFFTERRKTVPIEDIPKDLQNATVAFEDRRFYTHRGVDYQGIARALYSNIRHSDMKGEGGSTITQQLARNLGVEGLTRQKSAGRKFNELIIATEIEKSLTKQDILARYLNQINYGSGAYGVEAAAEVYFNKHVKQLNLPQCALLAGLPNRPNEFNPYKDIDAAKGQRNRVLDQMLKEGYVTQQQHDQSVQSPIKLAAAKAPSQGSQIFHAPYFVNYVVDQIAHQYGRDRIYDGNLKIYTTLNWPMQQIAEKELREGIARVRDLGPTQGALVCLDPQTGAIKAMVGGVDYKKTQTNYATHGRQPGSSFKAVVYSAAINDGSVKESTTVMDDRTTFGTGHGSYTPKDDSGYSDRRVTIREAMAQSINVPAIKVLHLIRPQTAIRYARMMGVLPTTRLDPVLSLALGSSPVSPLEMASVYSTFPAKGNHPEPTAWTRLADDQDTVIEDVPPTIETNVLQKDTVAQLDDMLQAVITEGTGRPVNGIVPEARGKTGTTQEHKDVWFVGYTPELVCAVWAGHPIERSKNHAPGYGEPMGSTAFGGTVCAPIWARFLSQALPIFHTAKAKELALEKSKLPPAVKPVTNADTAAAVTSETPADSGASSQTDRRSRYRARQSAAAHDNGDGTVTVTVDDSSGLLAPEGSTSSHPETFTAGTQPTTLSPQYSSGGDSTNTGGGTDNNTNSDTSAPVDNSITSNSTDSSRSRRHRRRASEDTVTVTINPEDGLLATKWDPQTVTRSYPRGSEPHRYSRMYPPPPGEK